MSLFLDLICDSTIQVHLQAPCRSAVLIGRKACMDYETNGPAKPPATDVLMH